MNILIIGERINHNECREKFGPSHKYALVGEHREAAKFLSGNDLVFDFIIDEEPWQIEAYNGAKNIVFLNSSKISLSDLLNPVRKSIENVFFGFNGLPTFLSAAVMEVCLNKKEDEVVLKAIFQQLNTTFALVEDRVGFVAPRVISMIINEAYYTVQEKTASREDIDKAMKLGTSYPYGPFEWCQRIGVKHVYELLEALYEDTHDERFKICPLLKSEYLNQ